MLSATTGAAVASIIDSDQHLYEQRSMWRDHVDPSLRDEALEIAVDDLGYAWLTWRGRRLAVADVQVPGDTAAVGRHRERRRASLPAEYDYDDALPASYWDPTARRGQLDAMGLDEAVLFPNFGLLWERRLSESLTALEANLAAWNRWCATVATDGQGRLHPVGHLTLRDPAWLDEQLAALERAAVRLAMVAPTPVDGRPLSHPDHDAIWRAFVGHGVTPVFHVADQPRVIDDAYYAETNDDLAPVIESVFLWTAAALAVTDLIVNGTFARHPELRVGIVELSSIWVPQFLLMLDGGWDFTTTLNGRPPVPLDARPSEYFLDRVRVSSFSYERPAKLAGAAGDIFMCCSDFPHSEGTATPVADYQRAGVGPDDDEGLFRGNIGDLLRR
jgi:hypothetical protein